MVIYNSSVKSILKQIISFPHEENLLTTTARIWCIIIRVMILIMAIVEAGAWGYFGSTFSDKTAYSLIMAFLVGLVIFFTIVIVDIALTNFDLAANEYQQKVYNKQTKSWLEKSKGSIGFLTRIAIVALSLTITSPFLAQLIFNSDIKQKLLHQDDKSIQQATKLIEAEYADPIKQRQKLIDDDRDLLAKEAGGREGGISGKAGLGPVVRVIRERIEANKTQLENIEAEKAKKMAEFYTALEKKDLELLRKKFSVELVQTGPAARAKVLEEIAKDPSYKITEKAVKVFLVLIFAALLILKLFQPNSVKLYLNEILQDLYKQYLLGAFDCFLEEHERSTKQNAMTIHRFNQFILQEYLMIQQQENKKRLLEEKLQLKKNLQKAIYALEEMGQMESIQNRPILSEGKGQLESLEKEKEEIENSKRIQEDAIGSLKKDIENIEGTLKKYEQTNPSLEISNGIEKEKNKLQDMNKNLQTYMANCDVLANKLNKINNEIQIVKSKTSKAEQAESDIEIEKEKIKKQLYTLVQEIAQL